jgi:hypothetical protein
MKGNLGSEVLLRVETLSEDNPATTDSLRAPDHTLVCQVMMASSSTPYPNVGDYKGRTGLSPPTAYPLTRGYEENEGNV